MSESDVMFCLQSYQRLTIDRSLCVLILPTGDLSNKLKWSVQVNVLLNSCKQNSM